MADKKIKSNIIIDGTIAHQDGGAVNEVFTTDGGRSTLPSGVVVSTDVNNSITEGGDGGAFFDNKLLSKILESKLSTAHYLYDVADDYSDLDTRANATGKNIVYVRTILGTTALYIKDTVIQNSKIGIVGSNVHIYLSSDGTRENIGDGVATLENVTGLNTKYGSWLLLGGKSGSSTPFSITADSSAWIYTTPSDIGLIQGYLTESYLPATGLSGSLYYSDAESSLKIWNGSAYEDLVGGGAPSTIVSTDAGNKLETGGDGGAFDDHFVERAMINASRLVSGRYLDDVANNNSDLSARADAFTLQEVFLYTKVGGGFYIAVRQGSSYDFTGKKVGVTFSTDQFNENVTKDYVEFLTVMNLITTAGNYDVYFASSTTYVVNSAVDGDYISIFASEPASGASPTIISTDANNDITGGIDGGAYLRMISTDADNTVEAGLDGGIYDSYNRGAGHISANRIETGRYLNEIAADFSDLETRANAYGEQLFLLDKTAGGGKYLAIRTITDTPFDPVGLKLGAQLHTTSLPNSASGNYVDFGGPMVLNGVYGSYTVYENTGPPWGSSRLTTASSGDYVSFSSGIFSLPSGGGTTVSTDANNDITSGGDGGAFLQLPAAQTIVSSDANNNITAGADGGSYLDTSSFINREQARSIASPHYFAELNLKGEVQANYSDLVTVMNSASIGAVYIDEGSFVNFRLVIQTGLIGSYDPLKSDFSAALAENPYGLAGETVFTINNVGIETTVGSYTIFESTAGSSTMSKAEVLALSANRSLVGIANRRRLPSAGASPTIVSADANNALIVGADGGAHYTERTMNSNNATNVLTYDVNGMYYDAWLAQMAIDNTAIRSCQYLHDIANDYSDLETRADAYLGTNAFWYRTVSGTQGFAVKNDKPFNFENCLVSAQIGWSGAELSEIYIRTNNAVTGGILTGGGNYKMYSAGSRTEFGIAGLVADAQCLIWLNSSSSTSGGGATTVVSTDANNAIVSGGDSGAFLNTSLLGETNNVEFYTNVAGFPATGTTDILYVAKTENTIHEWNGTSYDTIGGAGSYGEPEVIGTAREFERQQNSKQFTLTDSATLSWDLNLYQSAKLIATSGVGNSRTIPNSILTSAVEGGNYQLVFVQDATGGRQISLDTNFIGIGAIDVRANQITVVSLTYQNGIGYVVFNSFEGLVNGLSNTGTGQVLLTGSSIKSIIGGTDVSVVDNGNDITINNTKTLGNVGTGSTILTGNNFKSLKAGSNITLTPSATEILIDGAAGTNYTNAGAGNVLIEGTTIKSLVQGTGVTITNTATEVTINADGGGGGNPPEQDRTIFLANYGDDGTGVVGDSTSPFLTMDIALDQIPAGTTEEWWTVKILTTGTFNISAGWQNRNTRFISTFACVVNLQTASTAGGKKEFIMPNGTLHIEVDNWSPGGDLKIITNMLSFSQLANFGNGMPNTYIKTENCHVIGLMFGSSCNFYNNDLYFYCNSIVFDATLNYQLISVTNVGYGELIFNNIDRKDGSFNLIGANITLKIGSVIFNNSWATTFQITVPYLVFMDTYCTDSFQNLYIDAKIVSGNINNMDRITIKPYEIDGTVLIKDLGVVYRAAASATTGGIINTDNGGATATYYIDGLRVHNAPNYIARLRTNPNTQTVRFRGMNVIHMKTPTDQVFKNFGGAVFTIYIDGVLRSNGTFTETGMTLTKTNLPVI